MSRVLRSLWGLVLALSLGLLHGPLAVTLSSAMDEDCGMECCAGTEVVESCCGVDVSKARVNLAPSCGCDSGEDALVFQLPQLDWIPAERPETFEPRLSSWRLEGSPSVSSWIVSPEPPPPRS